MFWANFIAITLFFLTLGGIWNFMLQLKFMFYIKFTDDGIINALNITELTKAQGWDDRNWISDAVNGYVVCSVCLRQGWALEDSYWILRLLLGLKPRCE
jgi:hypothetical protein